MSDHLRKQIRDAVKSRLTGLSITGANVFGRGNPLASDQLPALRLTTVGDSFGNKSSLNDHESESRIVLRSVQFEVDAITRTSFDVEDAVDAISLQVEQAMMADRNLGGLARDVAMVGTEILDDFTGETPTVVAKLKFEIKYLCNEAAPSVPVVF
jgi:hypothetical protein